MRKIMTMLVMFAVLLSSTGCYKKVVAPAVPGVPTATASPTPSDTAAQKFDRTVAGAAGAVDSFSLALAGVDSARKNMFAAGSIDAATNTKILTVLKAAASKNETARVTCQLAATTGDTTVPWQQTILAVVAETQNLDPTLFGLKSVGAQNAFEVAFATLQVTVSAAEAAFTIQQGGN